MQSIKHFYKRYQLLLLGAVLLLGGCTKNLDQSPVSQANNAAVFGSQDGLQLYANSFYDILPGINDVFRTDCNLSDYGARNSVPDYIRPGVFTSRQSSGWTWTNLRNLNYFIANNTNPAVPQAVRDNFTALARFFRAYFYYGMVQRFGNVPWVSKPLTVNDTALLYAARDPRTKVMDSVLADLNYAIAHITLTTDASRSQITKWVIYGMKSRICLFEGTLRKYQDTLGLTGSANQWLQEAANAAKAVMDSAGFSLNTAGGTDAAYRNVFISNSPVSEVMLANVANSSLSVLNDANWYFTSATYGVRFNFTRTFINTYLNIDGTPFTDIPGHDTLPFWKETQNRDKRMAQTIRTPGYTRTSGGAVASGAPVFSYTYTGYQPIKWCLDDMYYDAGALNTNSISLMRYAEILLNFAEAQAELGQLSDAQWAATVGLLRSRAGITGGLSTKPAIADTSLQHNYFPNVTEPSILEIRRERGIELSLEGFRFADLTRWNRGALLLQPWNGFYVPALNQLMDLDQDGKPDVCFYQGSTAPGSVSGVTYVNVSAQPQVLDHGTYGELHWLDNVARTWSFYMYLYPIPYSDLQLNPNLQQNPGWQ